MCEDLKDMKMLLIVVVNRYSQTNSKYNLILVFKYKGDERQINIDSDSFRVNESDQSVKSRIYERIYCSIDSYIVYDRSQ